MARMSDNDECPSRDFGDSLQLTNLILDSGALCHMMPQVSDFVPGLLDNTDKHTGKTKSSSTNKCVRQ